jgi:hypothetical protein
MINFDPLFPSAEEMDRRLRAGRLLRSEYLHGALAKCWMKVSGQGRAVRLVEISAAAALVGLAVFWTALLGAPPVTEAGMAAGALNPDQLTLVHGKDLPFFEDRHQRHMGVLDTLERR